jgi:hypothetical protein
MFHKKKHRYNNPSCTYSIEDTQLLLDEAGLCGLDVDSVNSSNNYFAYLYIPASEIMLHQKQMQIAH